MQASLTSRKPNVERRTLALRARDFFEGDLNDPSGVNVENLEALSDGFPDVTLCSNIIERSMAASRTFRRREEVRARALA